MGLNEIGEGINESEKKRKLIDTDNSMVITREKEGWQEGGRG